MVLFGFDDIQRWASLTVKSIFHTALNLFKLDGEIMLESVPGTSKQEARGRELRHEHYSFLK